MNKFDKWWYEFGGGYATPGGDEEDAARYAWESALDAAVEAIETLSNDSGVGLATDMVKIMAHHEAIEAINKLRGEK